MVVVVSCIVGLFIEFWKITKVVDIKVCGPFGYVNSQCYSHSCFLPFNM